MAGWRVWMHLSGLVQANEALRGHTREIQQHQQQMTGGAHEPAVMLPTARRCDRRLRRPEQAPTPCQTPYEIDVFHDRQMSVAAHRFEDRASYENRLITVRQTKNGDSCAHGELDYASHQRFGIERESETTGDNAGIPARRLDRISPS